VFAARLKTLISAYLALECPERDGPERLPSMLIYTMACGQAGRFTQIDATVQAAH